MERIKGNCALPQPAAPLDSFFSKRLHIKRDLNPVLPRGIQTCFENRSCCTRLAAPSTRQSSNPQKAIELAQKNSPHANVLQDRDKARANAND